MVTRKRGKISRHRGSHTHGFGAMKKHRGAGNKGGKGNAGSGKRADSKKPSFWKDKNYFGKFGFVSLNREKCITINIQDLEKRLEKHVAEGKITHAQGIYSVDLTAWGIDKLLATGKPLHKFNIIVFTASQNAISKIEQAGGKVTVSINSGEEAAEDEFSEDAEKNDDAEEQ